MSARVLFCCWPFEGHVFPQLSMALALRERGNEVAFYTGGRLRETIEREGVQVFPFAQIEPAWLGVQEREREVGGRRQSLRVQHQAFRAWLVETIPSQVEDLRAIIGDWQADVLVTDASMWGPSLVLNEALPIPVALASPVITAVIPGPDAPPPGSGLPPAHNARERARAWAITHATRLLGRGLRRRLDQLRAQFGLPAMGCGINERCGQLPLYMVLSVAELDFNRHDLPNSVHYVGACTWHPPEPVGTSEWLDQLPRTKPWVHVTEGTSHYQDPFVLRAAVNGLADAPLEAIITHGRDRRPEELGLDTTAANVHLAPWLSHDALLPRCQVLVTTGGAGTVMAGLQAGVPLVIVPTTWDKPDNAQRVVAAGAGLIVSPRRCTPRSLRDAVETVLMQPRYREAAQRCAALLAQAPGPSGAAELIEALAPPQANGNKQAAGQQDIERTVR
jgi:MGT family glycosyltransferase